MYSSVINTTRSTEKWEVLQRFFPGQWQEKARELGALIRRRKFDSAEQLLRVLLIHIAEGKSLRTTVTLAAETGWCEVYDTALLKRLRAAAEWLRWMARELL